MAELFIGLSPEQVKRSELLMAADRHLLAGDQAAANALYRQAKEAKWLAEMTSGEAIVPITNPEDLPPAGRVYWREAQAGLESGFPNRVLVPLELLVKDYPEFLPAQALYVRYLIQQERMEEAQQIVEAAALRFPYHPDILRAEIQIQMAQEKWIEAAITANQFAMLNPDHPDAGAMEQLAEENLSRFRGEVNANLTRNLVTNIITGAASYFLTGGLFGPFTALNSGILLMQGESALGQQAADQVKRQLPIVSDPEVRDYVNEVGQKLAALAGRDEFNYTFEVVMDDSLNAFALPGGKIFINAGAITNSYSEAELAGLLGHEISHAVLSHGFQMVTQGNLTASLAAFIPIPEVANIAANLIVASYSRDMERQSDILGTKLLSTGRYAADGLHNLMATLETEYGNRSVTWFSSHPNPGERISYLKQLIDQGGFERYTYEGVEKHLNVRKKTMQLINEYRLENSRQDKLPSR
jgi:Zn-dependent protease with chaperone function